MIDCQFVLSVSLSESRITRIARIIGLEIQGCLRKISIFAQQIDNQQTIQNKTSLVNSTLIHKLNNPRNPRLIYITLRWSEAR